MVFEIITFRLKCIFTTIKNHRGWEKVIADFINDLDGYDDKKGRWGITMKKLNARIRSLQKESLEKNTGPDEWAMTSMRFSLKGGRSLSTFEGREWIPKGLEKHPADDMDGLGSMWVHRNVANSVRCANEGFVFDSLGRWLFGLKDCNVVVFTWPTVTMLEIGTTSMDVLALWENLSDAEFDEHFKTVKHCCLTESGTVWIPYGWSCMTAGLPRTTVAGSQYAVNSLYLTCVHLNRKLYHAVARSTRELIERHLFMILMV